MTVKYSDFYPIVTVDGIKGTAVPATRNVNLGDWTAIANGTTLNVGDTVQYYGSTFIVVTGHTKGAATGTPDVNPAYKIYASVGANGQTTYTWIAYADSADGATNFTTGAPGTRAYIGIAANQAGATESTNYLDYTWSKMQGPQGPTIIIASNKTGFIYINGVLNPTPQTINYTATLSGITGTITWTTSPNVKSGTGTTFSLNNTEMSTNAQVVITASAGGYSQTIFAQKIADSAADPTASNTAAAITNQGALAIRSKVSLGDTYIYRTDGTTSLTDALAVTSLGTAASITGQGALATKTAVTYGTADVTGFGALAGKSTATYGTGDVTGFGALAARPKVSLGDGFIFKNDAVTGLTDAIAVTSIGTAAAITGQAPTATSSDYTVITGTKPPAGATVGGDINNVNIIDSGNTSGTVTLPRGELRTVLGTAAALTGQGRFATRNSVPFGDPDLTGFGPLAGRAKIALGDTYIYQSDGTTSLTDASAVTSLGTAASITGQGALATKTAVTYGTADVTGFGALAGKSTATYGTGDVTGFGALAARPKVSLGDGFIFKNDAVTGLTDALAVTSLGTAASIAGQGALATKATVTYGTADVTGFGALAGKSTATYGTGDVTGFGALAARPKVSLGDGFIFKNDAVTGLTDALAVTSLGTAASIAGQGALATKATVTYGTADVTGFGALAGKSTATYGTGDVTGFGALAARPKVSLGDGFIFKNDAVTGLTDALAVTSLGTAASITGQTAWATDARPPSSVFAPPANIIKNPGFALRLANWTGPNWGFTSGTVEGPYIYCQTASNNVISSSGFRVSAGYGYSFAAEMTQNTFTSGTFDFDVQWCSDTNAQTVILDGNGVNIPINTGWVKKRGYEIAPAGAQSAYIRFFGQNLVGSGTIAVRRVQMYLGDLEVPFEDNATDSALYQDGQVLDNLKPQETGSNKTETRVAASVSGQGDLATTNRALLPFIGQNSIINSDFAHVDDNLLGWTPSWNGNSPGTPVVSRGVNLAGSPNWYGQTNVAYATLVGATTAGYVFDGHDSFGSTEATQLANFKRWALPVYPGDLVFASALVAAHRCTAGVEIVWMDGAAGYLNESESTLGGRNGGGNNGDPGNFDRLTVIGTAPAYARYAYMHVRGHTQSSVSDPYIFYTQMMLAKLPAGQTAIPPYSPGPGERSATRGAYFGGNLRESITGPTATVGAYRTADGSAASIAGQGAFATLSTLTDNSRFSGSLANRLTPYTGDVNYLAANRVAWTAGYTVEDFKPAEAGANITSTHTASGIAGQGALATRSRVVATLVDRGEVTSVIPDSNFNDVDFWNISGTPHLLQGNLAAPDWRRDRGLRLVSTADYDFLSAFFNIELNATYRVTFRIWNNDTSTTMTGAVQILMHHPQVAWWSPITGGSVTPGQMDAANGAILAKGDTGYVTKYFRCSSAYMRQVQFRFISTARGQDTLFQVEITKVPQVGRDILKLDQPVPYATSELETGLGTASAIANQGDLATANRASLAFGDNAVVDSEFAQGIYGGYSPYPYTTVGGYPSTFGMNYTGYYGLRQVFYFNVNTSGAALPTGNTADCIVTKALWNSSSINDMQRYGMPVKNGDTLYWRALIAVHRCNCTVFLLIFDKNGTLLIGANASGGRSFGGANGDPANFDQIGGTTVISGQPTAAYAAVMIRMLGTGQSDPYLFMTEPAMGILPAGQTVIPPYKQGKSNPLGYLDYSYGQVPGQKNMPPINAANLSFKYTGGISATATAGSPATGTITVAAGSLLLGADTISYNSMSVNVTGTNGVTSTFFLYLDDANYVGGSQTLVATTTATTIYGSRNRIYLGAIDIAFPSSGTYTPPPTGGGSGGCVEANAFVLTTTGYKRAKDIIEADCIWGLKEDNTGGEWLRVQNNYVTKNAGWKIISESGIELDLSQDTPLELLDGTTVYPADFNTNKLAVEDLTGFRWETCKVVNLHKSIEVAHISVGGRVYAAGKETNALIFTHNAAKP